LSAAAARAAACCAAALAAADGGSRVGGLAAAVGVGIAVGADVGTLAAAAWGEGRRDRRQQCGKKIARKGIYSHC